MSNDLIGCSHLHRLKIEKCKYLKGLLVKLEVSMHMGDTAQEDRDAAAVQRGACWSSQHSGRLRQENDKFNLSLGNLAVL